jgi:uracil-DNA glycosylase
MLKFGTPLFAYAQRAAMIGQSKINAFFQRKTADRRMSDNTDTCAASPDLVNRCNETGSNKRKRDVNDNPDEDGNAEDARPISKIASSSVDSTDSSGTRVTEGSPVIDQQQKGRMEENRLRAKMTLVKTHTHGLVAEVGPSWFTALEPEFSKPYFLKLAQFVNEERKKYTIYPPVDQVFAWTRMTHIRDTKVVIIGQDPYHGPNQAHGLCFSVQKGVALPPSLENMYKELSSDIEGFVAPSHGCLVGWAQQGVLLLNAVLTVRAHAANSHKDQGWETFTDAVISWLNSNTTGTVFLLWGSYAHKKGARISRSKHHVIQGVHPSPLSAYRGFFGCHHFSRCNDFLRAQGKTPINWALFV